MTQMANETVNELKFIIVLSNLTILSHKKQVFICHGFVENNTLVVSLVELLCYYTYKSRSVAKYDPLILK